MKHKSASGNQAIFSTSVVKQLLSNPRVKQLFALAKYGCCCCLEERIWIGAMDILGYLEEAKSNRAMFQVWGGDKSNQCEGSMKNAILNEESDKCFRNENPNERHNYFYGNETWNKLLKAKQEQGIYFARKFHSTRNSSIELLNKIRDRMHV